MGDVCFGAKGHRPGAAELCREFFDGLERCHGGAGEVQAAKVSRCRMQGFDRIQSVGALAQNSMIQHSELEGSKVLAVRL